METAELLEIINRGEDSKHQFKANFTNADSLASELVAFSNSGGGQIFIGVHDDGTSANLNSADIHRLNQLISNSASQNVHDPINPLTENVNYGNSVVIVVTVADGIRRPYMDNAGAIWVKSGSDKRRVTAIEEIQRMFQTSGLIHGDEIPANGITVSDIDLDYFRKFYQNFFGESIDQSDIPLSQLLENMNLAKDGFLNVAGAILFSDTSIYRLPTFIVKAVAFPGAAIEDTSYLDSRDISGKLLDVFQVSLGFVSANLRKVQDAQGFNSQGEWEIPREVLEELIANALIHRDYFISAPIRLLVFADRVEIVSPGNLPNNLTVENIINGNSNIRNPILASFAAKDILPYRGLGSGIKRSLRLYPNISFIDDKDANLFVVKIWRADSLV